MTLTLGSSAKAIEYGESTLVQAARDGDDRAFEQLYERYRQRIFSFILNRVHDHGRAEDIAQEVFISALRRLRSSDGQIAFKPWIYEIAKNACIDEYRRGTRQREVPLEADGELITDRGPALRTAPTPAAAVEGKQRLDDLRGAFGGLSASYHQLLVMREFEGLTYDEIGARLGMTRPMVESSLFRARRKLSEEYEELASGRRCEQVQHAIAGGRLRSARDLGLRDRRRFARHLAHCQPCRHVALTEGVDSALVQPRRITEKIAAILPFPLVRRLLAARGSGVSGSAASALGGRAAAVVAAAALAGAGGGVIHVLGSGQSSHPGAPHAVDAADLGVPAPIAGDAVIARPRHPVVLPARPAARHAAAARRHRAAARHSAARLRTSHAHASGPSAPGSSSAAPRTAGTAPAASPAAGGSGSGGSHAAPAAAGAPAPLAAPPAATSLVSAVGSALGSVTGSGSNTSSVAGLLGSGSLGSVVGAATGLASTLGSAAGSLLGAAGPAGSGSGHGSSAASAPAASAGSAGSAPQGSSAPPAGAGVGAIAHDVSAIVDSH